MAPVRVFLTGASGYIGGTVLDTIVKEFPSYRYAVLVRGEDSANKIKKVYPTVEIIRGDLDSLDLLEKEAAAADIVVNTANNDHTASIPAILAGLSTPFPPDDPLARNPAKNRYLIHTSGTSILLDKAFGRGTRTAHMYDDGGKLQELVYNLPDDAWHRDVDKLVLFPEQCPRADNVHVAIICPPCVYGRGTGTGKIVSWQLPQMVKHFIKRGDGFTVDKGEAVWGNVHVVDLADLYALLVDLAVTGSEDPKFWNTSGGYYLSASGEHHWGDTMKLVAQLLYQQGKTKSAEVDQLSPDEVRALGAKTGPLEWGCNSRGRAVHAIVGLGWKPSRGSRAPASEVWGQDVSLGLGRDELLNEIAMVEEGLCQ